MQDLMFDKMLMEANSELILDHFLSIIATDLWTRRLHTGSESRKTSKLKQPLNSKNSGHPQLLFWRRTTIYALLAFEEVFLGIIRYDCMLMFYRFEAIFWNVGWVNASRCFHEPPLCRYAKKGRRDEPQSEWKTLMLFHHFCENVSICFHGP